MINLTYLEADYRICTDDKFNFNGMHYNFVPSHDYDIKRYTDRWKMSLDQMKETINVEKIRRANLFALFESEADNSILKHARMVANYLNNDHAFDVEMENPLKWVWDRNTKEHIAVDMFTKEFQDQFGSRWSYSYFDTKVSLNELMAYVTFYSESGYNIGKSSYVCGVAEYSITPKLIRTINQKLILSSRYRAANEYAVLEKAERERKIEAFRLKQIYGE